jgi:hypothetical protein
MKRTLILILMAWFCAFAQEGGNVLYQSAGPAGCRSAPHNPNWASGKLLGTGQLGRQ